MLKFIFLTKLKTHIIKIKKIIKLYFDNMFSLLFKNIDLMI